MEMNTTLIMVGVGAGAVLLFVLFVVAVVRAFYVVPEADEALVKTGAKHPTVHTGGVFVVPLVHRVKRVSLRAVQVPIVRKQQDALPTADGIPAEIMGELIVQIDPSNADHIVLAAQSIGSDEQGEMGAIIEQQTKSLVEDALRTAAFRKNFLALQSEKKEFAGEVMHHLQEDLLKLGLTLKAVTIPHVGQGIFSTQADDVIAAMGRKNVAATVAENRQKTNEIERAAEMKIREQNLAARRQALEIERQQKELEAEQTRQVQEIEATKATEAKKAVLTQEEERSVAEAHQAKAVETARIEQMRQIEAARIAYDQGLSVQRAQADAAQKVAQEEASRQAREAEIAREQSVKVAFEKQQQAVAEAEIAKQVAIAARKEQEAKARAAQASAEAEQRAAEEGVKTVHAEAEADRQRRVTTIKAEEEAARDKVAADRDAYVATKRAEGERDAVQKLSEAKVLQARASAESQTIEAEGYGANLLTRAAAEAEAAQKQAEARTRLAEATLAEGRAKAEAQRLAVEAGNAVATSLLARDVALEAIRVAPAVVHELMQPITAISDVKVVQVNGLGGDNGQANLPSTILGTGMALSGVLPVLREVTQGLLQNEELKVIGGGLKSLATETVREVARAASAPGKDA